ncbi:hypothetical protein [Microbacterium candidum]|uniref:Uncharacterized protein n=1 Tax=Microbacterium candidum TaxID=3041922 RepID=A0ABT7MZ98_9MICO|nr:hypothetical protein [Microbacterium sp. ASV49]MDL9979778.1 hypothetical protein [Microbacterium sp. ASV49]
MSLFVRRAEVFLDAATVLWLCTFVITWFGMGIGDDGWSVSRYLLSSAFIALAALATTGALVGLSARRAGRMDAPSLAIGGLGLLSAVAAALLAWVVGIWLPLLAAALVWTLARTRHQPAMSHRVSLALLIVVPILGVGAIATSALSFTTGGTEPLLWGLVAAFAAAHIVGLVSATARLGRDARHAAA